VLSFRFFSSSFFFLKLCISQSIYLSFVFGFFLFCFLLLSAHKLRFTQLPKQFIFFSFVSFFFLSQTADTYFCLFALYYHSTHLPVKLNITNIYKCMYNSGSVCMRVCACMNWSRFCFFYFPWSWWIPHSICVNRYLGKNQKNKKQTKKSLNWALTILEAILT